MVTISTHNGSKVAREHNIRNVKVVSKENHIDLNGIHETWIDEPVRQAYERLFGKAIEKYNANQSRPERRIKSYYNNICKDQKKHPVYEMIIGVYGKSEDGSPICSVELGKEIMHKFVDTWQERNPNLELIGAYYHADEEGEPHVHLDYIPIAHGYKKGLETQTGLVKALGEQGFEKMGKATAQIQWEKRENAYLTRLCEDVGLTVLHPKETQKQHIETDLYKAEKRAEEAIKWGNEAVVKADDAEMKAFEAEQRLKDTNEEIEKAETKKSETEKILEEKQAALTAVESQLESLQGHILNLQEVNAIQGKKSLTGALKGVSYEEYLSLKKTAEKVNSVQKENKKLKSENKGLKEENSDLQEKLKVHFSRNQLNQSKKSADAGNKNRLLCSVLGIPEHATYDEAMRLLKQNGIISKNKNNHIL